jgi:uncharacterized protein YbjT (DUF2867 family)
MNILVVGATGGVGKHVADILHSRGVPFKASSRDPSKAKVWGIRIRNEKKKNSKDFRSFVSFEFFEATRKVFSSFC